MARTLLYPTLVLATLCWVGPLSIAAHAQVDVNLGVDLGETVDDATGTVDDAAEGVVGDDRGGAVDDAVGGLVDSITPGNTDATATLDQQGAIEAVASNRALPLEQIMIRARLHTQGEIVDAQLISLNGFLLYELKVVEANGDVDELYFYALSGELVQTN
ncbi:MAG: PepSY domain-containing protein [Devosia sp.]